ncbi:hypothetical protein M409DRAFT_29904 [Zasmidium cellare ATCC 36951]|uniref:DUF6590 domain-containing protein n=1 Tax=Zasmidium cellare ATCC 36951 TaxID=1080233 RepID=A0A6A6BXZ9_ZASCE|nr:uncharacterized protein M409DRAFT_29904 [Zasmidium cellare ATCC 36951]KAF2159585.1 hypothetical protein M409DRAFT_29904 [Zasmidium cellare ATCC 36951]
MERLQWQWSPTLQKYFYYDVRTGDYVLQDGSRHPRGGLRPRYAPSNVAPSPPTPYGRGPGPSAPGSAAPYYPQATSLQSSMAALDMNTSAGDSGFRSMIGAYNTPPPYGVSQQRGNLVPTDRPPSYGVQPMDLRPQNSVTGRSMNPTLSQVPIGDTETPNGRPPVETESPHPVFKLRKKDFFCVGRVFKTLWVEPVGEIRNRVSRSSTLLPSGATLDAQGQDSFAKVRYFVVIRPGHKSCTVLPIASYGGQGVAKAGVKKSDHAIIYTGRDAPSPTREELPGFAEQPMRAVPIRVVPDDKSDGLNPLTRLNLAHVSTIQHNLKVATFGKVHPESLEPLLAQFRRVWMDSVSGQSSRATATGPHNASRSAAGPSTQVDNDSSDE